MDLLKMLKNAEMTTALTGSASSSSSKPKTTAPKVPSPPPLPQPPAISTPTSNGVGQGPAALPPPGVLGLNSAAPNMMGANLGFKSAADLLRVLRKSNSVLS